MTFYSTFSAYYSTFTVYFQRAWSTLKKSIIMISLLICFIGLTATYMSEKIKNDTNQDLNELFVQNGNIVSTTKVGCVYAMVIVSILPHAEFGPNDHREDAFHFILCYN